MSSTLVFYTLVDGTKGSVSYPYPEHRAIAAASGQLIADGERGFTIIKTKVEGN